MGQSVLITGGAGFIGSNLALSYLEEGRQVHIFDNLSRQGVETNIELLRDRFGSRLIFTEADTRNGEALSGAIANASAIYHLAAQVAVTTSLVDPVADFETNLCGTFRLLEAVRRSARRIPLLFTSTNKVYGHLQSIPLTLQGRRYLPVDSSLRTRGVSENQPLQFLSPYGCSKGSADQYVLDYSASYGLPAVVFRMSCIYGPYQLGTEDQGWVAHFLRQALKGQPITLFGDGCQVRDLLFVKDLVRAMRFAHDKMEKTAGQAFNLGGGPQNSWSLLEVVERIQLLLKAKLRIGYQAERLGDQRWFVADTTKISNVLGWQPRVALEDGLRELLEWYVAHPHLLQTEAQVA